MSKGWERVFHLLTWITQGSSYISPRAYAIMHRMHHTYVDTPRDPHSPANHTGVMSMMWQTAKIFGGIRTRTLPVEARFEGGYPEWRLLDETLYGWGPGLAWAALYTLFYVHFATTPWLFLLLPVHFVMGPVHGAIVNWFGHRLGYRNFRSRDDSRNSLPLDLFTGGELMQNNHHHACQSPNFASRWFELDTTWQWMRLLGALRIIDLRRAVTMKARRRAAGRPALVG
jgi:stearoyl-CoA desaturase (delta-9 desaturase)